MFTGHFLRLSDVTCGTRKDWSIALIYLNPKSTSSERRCLTFIMFHSYPTVVAFDHLLGYFVGSDELSYGTLARLLSQ